ncbi:unnamed protein product [Litomosoides sigmodontis]|uniref:Uncharacterized protein n=1 Tax=Litomosoides sigmodontis TaxID=42156 RepID=A0A3P6SSM2_LITSI|nr:unnamed protein product [Litomosoides sigmodontis]
MSYLYRQGGVELPELDYRSARRSCKAEENDCGEKSVIDLVLLHRKLPSAAGSNPPTTEQTVTTLPALLPLCSSSPALLLSWTSVTTIVIIIRAILG